MNALVLASLAALSAAPQAADTVTLTFDWPVGMELQGNTKVTARQSQAGEEIPEQSGEASFILAIADHPQGVLVSRTVDAGPLPAGVTLPPEPSYIIGESGTFVGVQDLDSLVSQLRAQMLAQMNAQAGGQAPPEVQAMIDDLIDAETIQGTVRQDYMTMVGYWAGNRFERNEVEFTEGTYPDPITQSLIPAEYELVWRGYAPCAEGEAENSCVRLDISLFPDSDQLAVVLEQFFASQNSGAPGGIIVESVNASADVSILAEPGTLIPRQVDKAVETVINLSAGGEAVDLSITQTEKTGYSRATPGM